MAERKVINKYYPPDFDPAKIPRRKQPKNQQIKVRMMLPMSVRCATCGNYIYKGTKFNSRKEDVFGENYLGIQIFRFYFRCTKCSAELTFKTDPQNSDYLVESGASRNFEPWRAEDEQTEKEKRKRDSEEMGDAMKSLENRTLDSKQEMDILSALDEMKSMKSRQATVSVDAVLQTLKRMNEEKAKKLEEEDEAEIRALYQGLKEKYVRRIDDEEIEDDADLVFRTSSIASKKQRTKEVVPENPTDSLTKDSVFGSSSEQEKAGGLRASKVGKFLSKSSTVTISVRHKRPSDVSSNNSAEQEKNKPDAEQHETVVPKSGLHSLFQQYESDEDD